jgi:Leucine-rich repeat (LRR) protein
MKTKLQLTILSLLLCACFNALNAQVKPKPLTDKEKEQLIIAKSIEEAMQEPDSVQALFINYAQQNSIPEEVEKCKNLIVLDLGVNNIKEIPLFIFDLTKLQELGLSHNKISRIPEEIFHLKNLTSIKCWNNSISEVPDELLNLPNIQEIELKGNPIPKEERKRLQKAYPNIKFLF